MIDCYVCVSCARFVECEASARCDSVFMHCESCNTGNWCYDNCFTPEEEENENADI